MRSTRFALCFALVGCAATPAGDDPDDAPPIPGDEGPAWTDGTSTLAGTEEAAYLDGPRGRARFNNPVNVAFKDGVVYVADFDNSKIRMVEEDGTTSTLVAQPDFLRPFAMTFGTDGRLYVTTDKATDGELSDMSGTVWRIDIPSCTATVVAHKIGRPRGLAWYQGKLAVSDYNHHVIQLVDPTTGAVTPFLGTWDAPGMVDGVGGAAKFSSPYGMVVDAQGRLIVADYDNNRVRIVADGGAVTTLAGTAAGFADGVMANAKFDRPQGLTIDQSGTIYLTDTDNFRIRRIAGANVETVAGTGTGGYLDNDVNLAAQFYGLEGLAVSQDGAKLYVADGNRGEDTPHNRIRVIKLQ